MTVVTIIAIGAIVAFFWFMWPQIQQAITGQWGEINDVCVDNNNDGNCD